MQIPVSAADFMFDGRKLSDFGMILCRFGNSSLEEVPIGNKITYHTARPPMSGRHSFVSAVYEEPITASLQICKNRCGLHSDGALSASEISTLLSWLIRTDGYHTFRLYQDGYEDLYFNAYFSDVQAVRSSGKVYGLTLTIQTDSPYAYADTVVVDLDLSAGQTYELSCFSDEPGTTPPKLLTVLCQSGGDLCLTNISDNNRKLYVSGCSVGERLTFDCIHKIITSSKSTPPICNRFNYNYFRLVSTCSDRQNLITANIDCRIHLEYNPIRKVGII